jgi:hypothetical protein
MSYPHDVPSPPEAGDVFRAIAGADAVFVEIPAQDVVATVLNAPVAAVDGQESPGSLFWHSDRMREAKLEICFCGRIRKRLLLANSLRRSY